MTPPLTDASVARLRLHAQGIAHPRDCTPAAIVQHLGAVQAQDYQGALCSIGLRTTKLTRADVEHAIAERTIVRTWPMRGTLHFVPASDARWMLALLAPRVIKGAAGRYKQLELDDAAFRRSRTLVTKALTGHAVLSRSTLFDALTAGGVPTTGQRGIHILQRLAMEAVICFGPHSERQPMFVLFDDWIAASHYLERDDALCVLTQRYFVGHGPATLNDFVRWTGLTVADARRGLELAHGTLEPAQLPHGGGWMAADAPTLRAASRAHLLPGFDELMLGYGNRRAALAPEHAGRIVPGNNGMFISTLLLDAQVRGTWRRTTRTRAIELHGKPFAPLSSAGRKAFAEPVARYAAFLGVPVSIAWDG